LYPIGAAPAHSTIRQAARLGAQAGGQAGWITLPADSDGRPALQRLLNDIES